MDNLKKQVIQHLLESHCIAVAVAAVLANIDRLIGALLKVFSSSQLDAEVDKLAALAKARIDQDAQKK